MGVAIDYLKKNLGRGPKQIENHWALRRPSIVLDLK